MNLLPTVRFTRRRSPQLEASRRRYFVIVRCAEGLPRRAAEHVRELQLSLACMAPQSPQFSALQQQIFRTVKQYLDGDGGSGPLCHGAADIVTEEFAALSDWAIDVPHFSVKPNHWQALLVPGDGNIRSLSAIMERLKDRTDRRLRAILGSRGPIWQDGWFDRWVCDDDEWTRVVDYIHANPGEPDLVTAWSESCWAD